MQRNPNGENSVKNLVQGLVITAIAILLVGGGLTFLLNSQVVKLQSIADNKEAEVGSSEQVAKRFELTQTTYNDTLSRIQYLETSVTQRSYVPTMLKQMQALAQTTHLKVLAVRPSQIISSVPKPEARGDVVTSTGGTGSDSSSSGTPAAPSKKKAPPYDTMDIALDIQGTYAATASFLYNLTKFPKIVSVTSVQLHPMGIAPGENPYSSPIIGTSLRLTAYVFHDDTEAAASPVDAIPGKTTSINGITPPPSVGTMAGSTGRAVNGARNASQVIKERTGMATGAL